MSSTPQRTLCLGDALVDLVGERAMHRGPVGAILRGMYLRTMGRG